jgi:hypothetical protein
VIVISTIFLLVISFRAGKYIYSGAFLFFCLIIEIAGWWVLGRIEKKINNLEGELKNLGLK